MKIALELLAITEVEATAASSSYSYKGVLK